MKGRSLCEQIFDELLKIQYEVQSRQYASISHLRLVSLVLESVASVPSDLELCFVDWFQVPHYAPLLYIFQGLVCAVALVAICGVEAFVHSRTASFGYVVLVCF